MVIGTGVPMPKHGTSLVVSHASMLEAYHRARRDNATDEALENPTSRRTKPGARPTGANGHAE